MTDAYEIEIYSTNTGKEPFNAWIASIKDKKTKTAILLRIQRLRQGDLGDYKVFDKIIELRMHYGPGIRVYCCKVGSKLILLLGGGDKRTQDRDIKKCKEYLTEYKGGNL